MNMSAASLGGALSRTFRTRMRLGLFDDAADQPYENAFGPGTVGSAAHHALSLEAANQAMTLLQNNGSALPLRRGSGRRVAVIGPNADGAAARALMAGGTGGCAHGTNLDARVVCKCAAGWHM